MFDEVDAVSGMIAKGKAERARIDAIKNAERSQRESEQKQYDFAREQQLTEGSLNDDQTYFASQDKHSDLIRWQQELDDEVRELIFFLRGYQQNEDGDWVKINDCDSFGNNKFINIVVRQVKPFLSRNMINTNYDEGTILTTLKYTFNDLAYSMSVNNEEYGIGSNTSKWDEVLRELKNRVKASIYRAKMGWTKKLDSTMTKRLEQFAEGKKETKESQGMFKGLFGG